VQSLLCAFNFGVNVAPQVPAKAGDGLFLPSCFSHGQGLGVTTKPSTTIQNLSSGAILGDWFFGRPNKYALLFLVQAH
jgi:hypothetical protein